MCVCVWSRSETSLRLQPGWAPTDTASIHQTHTISPTSLAPTQALANPETASRCVPQSLAWNSLEALCRFVLFVSSATELRLRSPGQSHLPSAVCEQEKGVVAPWVGPKSAAAIRATSYRLTCLTFLTFLTISQPCSRMSCLHGMARTDMFHGLNGCLVTSSPPHPSPIISDGSPSGHLGAGQWLPPDPSPDPPETHIISASRAGRRHQVTVRRKLSSTPGACNLLHYHMRLGLVDMVAHHLRMSMQLAACVEKSRKSPNVEHVALADTRITIASSSRARAI